MLTPESTRIDTLGECKLRSPLKLSTVLGDGVVNFVPDAARMPLQVERVPGQPVAEDVEFETAGPREWIYFDPASTRAAVVTCGGLCPGLNNVIRSIVLELHYHYHVQSIVGIRYGYQGLDPDRGQPPMELTPERVEDIHREGGTMLGSSRGPIQPAVAVEFLRRRGINILFTIGGDGTQRGAQAILRQAREEGYPLAVVGVPKTIDNDIMYVWRTFGFWTAIEKAREVIDGAHVESKGAPNAIAVVKLMGRDAGFIAAGSTVASQDVNFCLVPEVRFALDGPSGLLESLEKRILDRRHAVIVIAEGAGQDLIPPEQRKTDASGNVLHQDIGPFLVERIKQHFREKQIEHNVKYIDPSYIIRSIPADAEDALLCDALARNAVHAAMSGRTNCLIGYWYNVFVHVPIPLAVSRKKHLSPESGLWRGVLAATGQPIRMDGKQLSESVGPGKNVD